MNECLFLFCGRLGSEEHWLVLYLTARREPNSPTDLDEKDIFSSIRVRFGVFWIRTAMFRYVQRYYLSRRRPFQWRSWWDFFVIGFDRSRFCVPHQSHWLTISLFLKGKDLSLTNDIGWQLFFRVGMEIPFFTPKPARAFYEVSHRLWVGVKGPNTSVCSAEIPAAQGNLWLSAFARRSAVVRVLAWAALQQPSDMSDHFL